MSIKHTVPPLRSNAVDCERCGKAFRAKKKNCHNCGLMVCHECSSFKTRLPQFGYHKPVRCCGYCAHFLRVYNLDDATLSKLNIKTLKRYLTAYNIPTLGMLEKPELIKAIKENRPLPEASEVYFRKHMPDTVEKAEFFKEEFPQATGVGTSAPEERFWDLDRFFSKFFGNDDTPSKSKRQTQHSTSSSSATSLRPQFQPQQQQQQQARPSNQPAACTFTPHPPMPTSPKSDETRPRPQMPSPQGTFRPAPTPGPWPGPSAPPYAPPSGAPSTFVPPISSYQQPYTAYRPEYGYPPNGGGGYPPQPSPFTTQSEYYQALPPFQQPGIHQQFPPAGFEFGHPYQSQQQHPYQQPHQQQRPCPPGFQPDHSHQSHQHPYQQHQQQHQQQQQYQHQHQNFPQRPQPQPNPNQSTSASSGQSSYSYRPSTSYTPGNAPQNSYRPAAQPAAQSPFTSPVPAPFSRTEPLQKPASTAQCSSQPVSQSPPQSTSQFTPHSTSQSTSQSRPQPSLQPQRQPQTTTPTPPPTPQSSRGIRSPEDHNDYSSLYTATTSESSNTATPRRPKQSSRAPQTSHSTEVLTLAEIMFDNVDISSLSIKVIKSLLDTNCVNYIGVVEKSELVNCLQRLIDSTRAEQDRVIKELEKESTTTPQSQTSSPTSNAGAGTGASEDDNLCKICFEDSLNCVMLNCNHMSTCMDCGKMILEGSRVCPICREYVVKLLHVFRA